MSVSVTGLLMAAFLPDLRVCLQGAKLDSRRLDTAAAEHASLHLPVAWGRCIVGFSGQQAGAGRYSAGTAVLNTPAQCLCLIRLPC
jgi:hypothetical protein